jgi:hypothetical protein
MRNVQDKVCYSSYVCLFWYFAVWKEDIPVRKRMMLNFLCLLCFLLAGCAAPSSSNPGANSTQPLLSILPKDSLISQISVPTALIGMNLEMSEVCSILQMDQSYEQLDSNLGELVLHIAGHSGDLSTWQPDANLDCSTQQITSNAPVVSKAFVNAVFSFAQRTHAKVLWELPLLHGTPQMDASEASYITSVGKSTLIGFDIGNEPELNVKHGYRPVSWTFRSYLGEWKAIHDAVIATDPTARFVGPDTTVQTKQTNWLQEFLLDPQARQDLNAVARHYYFYSGLTHKHADPKSLLDPTVWQVFSQEAQGWVVAADKLPVYITETNTISSGGVPGTSNSLAAALWTSDMLLQAASVGVQQVDFQEVPHAYYSAIDTQGMPQNPYYGELFAHLVTPAGAAFLKTQLNFQANLSAYALQSQGKLYVILINKEANAMSMNYALGGNYHHVQTLQMKAASLGATAGTTINGASVGFNGKFTMPPMPLLAMPQKLTVPAYTACAFIFS